MISNQTKENIEQSIRGLMQGLKPIVFYSELPIATTRLVFLKYVIDNYVGANSIESTQKCAQAQKMLAMKNVDSGFEAVSSVLHYIDEAYGLEGVLSNPENLMEYGRNLFGTGMELLKKSATHSGYENTLEILGMMDLAEPGDNNELGILLADYLVYLIIDSTIRNRDRAEVSTKPQLGKLVKGILKVSGEDIFCDVASGLGISTINITKDVLPTISNVEINPRVAAISAMLYILYGYKDFNVKCDDSIRNKVELIHGNKMFVDAPIGLRLKSKETKYNNSTLSVIDNIAHYYLDANGIAVVTTPAGTLYQLNGQSIELRSDIISNGLVNAVIALPPMWTGTNIGTNLIVLSKKKNNDKVLFIDASSFTQGKNRKDAIGNELLPEETIVRIVDVIDDPKSLIGFSELVSIKKVEEHSFNLLPATYIEQPVKKENLSIKEIDSELEELYKQLTL